MGSTPTIPRDRLGKLPRRATVGIYLDDALADAHDAATVALGDARDRLSRERPRRLADGMMRTGADQPGAGPEDRARVVDAVDAAIAAEVAPLEAAVDETLAALDAGTAWYTFRSLGRKRFRALLDAHPAEDEDHEQAQRETGNPEAQAQYSATGLSRVLLAESAIAPKLKPADVDAIMDGDAWNDQEITALFVTAMSAQTQARAVTHRRPPVLKVAG